MPLSHIEHFLVAAGDIQKKYLGRTSQQTEEGTGALDHIAFRATGLRTMLEHLRKEKMPFSQRRANGQALFQLFLYDPNGIKIELNYAAQEAEGIEPELMASDLITQR